MNPKLWHPNQLNVWQYLALVGLVMTTATHGLLRLSHKVIPGFMYLYAVWVAVYVLGSIRNVTHEPGPDDHHHHHH